MSIIGKIIWELLKRIMLNFTSIMASPLAGSEPSKRDTIESIESHHIMTCIYMHGAEIRPFSHFT